MLNLLSVLLLLLAGTSPTQAQYNPTTGHEGTSTLTPQATCPWLTAGSAARALGGNVSVSVSGTQDNDGSCKFLKLQDPHDSLQVQVSKASLGSCTAEHTRLVGIGNEAAKCALPGSHGETVEMVTGRVRDVHFDVTLTVVNRRVPAKSPDEAELPLEQIAEQVAGNLY